MYGDKDLITERYDPFCITEKDEMKKPKIWGVAFGLKCNTNLMVL